jgi:hypothetical protein
MAITVPGLRVAARSRPSLSLGIEQLWLLCGVVLSYTLGLGLVLFASDSWWSLKMGQLTLDRGQPALWDALVHAPALPNVPNGQWLAQVVLYLAWQLGGKVAVQVLGSLAIAATVGLVMAAAREGGAGARVATLAGIVALFLMAENTIARSQLLCYPLFALVGYLLLVGRRRPRLLYLLPSILLLWSNLHGSFTLGLLLIGVETAGLAISGMLRERRLLAASSGQVWRLVGVLLASAAAAAVHPLGPAVYGYVGAVVSSPIIRKNITEWAPTNVQQFSGMALWVAMVLLVAALRVSRRRITPAEVLLLAAISYLALSAVRSVVWWGLAAAPIMARHLASIEPPAWLRAQLEPGSAAPARSMLNVVAAALLIGQALVAPSWLPPIAERAKQSEPYEPNPTPRLADYVSTLPVGSRLFHFQPWTGYLAWRLWPNQQPMLDNRIEAQPVGVWEDFAAVEHGLVGWQALLDMYGIDYLVLHHKKGERLIGLAEASGAWQRVYVDETAVVLGRR